MSKSSTSFHRRVVIPEQLFNELWSYLLHRLVIPPATDIQYVQPEHCQTGQFLDPEMVQVSLSKMCVDKTRSGPDSPNSS